MKKFWQWFTSQWRIDSEWPFFTYLLFGLFIVFEIVSQIMNGLGMPRFVIFAVCAYLIACLIGYIKRNDP